MDQTDDDAWLTLVAWLVGVGNLPLMAFVTSSIWGWHAVPMGAGPMPWPSALALLLLLRVTFLSALQRPPIQDAEERLKQRLAYTFLVLFVLGMGWFLAWCST